MSRRTSTRLAADAAGVVRVRDLLGERAPIQEKTMFGCYAFMVNEKLAVAVRGDGSLLLRVDPDRDLLDLPGAAQAEMGAGRSMGPEWISVAADAVVAPEQLAFWVGVALERNAHLTRRPVST